LSAALAGCNGEGGAVEYPGANPSDDPLPKNPVGYTVSYQTGNGAGTSPLPKVITENTSTTLPDAVGLEAPNEGAVFVGWNDGLLTYPAKYQYTVTKNVTFKARWAFTKLSDITAYLADAPGAPMLIAVADVEPPDGSLTWEALLSAIQTACSDDKTVELDLTGSTLALVNENKFDYKNGGDTKNTGEQYIKKLVLPSTAASIGAIFKDGPFSRLETVSGLKVNAIPDSAFNSISTLAAIVFPAAETIGKFAFYNCSKLAEVSLPKANNIDTSVFYNCSKLAEVSLPKAETIGTSVFSNCSELAEVSLPKANNIDTSTFSNCSSLISVSLPAAKTIGISAFFKCASLTSVSLPEATEISDRAFDSCSNLAGVSLPAAETIGTGAFYNCTSLTNITIAEKCTISDTSDALAKFKTYYNDTMKEAAGYYTYSSGSSSWSYKALK
jgi:uncharacterized protein YjbI with pentapeptide repeats